MSAIAAEGRRGGGTWRKWASRAYGAAAIAYALLLVLALIVVGGYHLLGGRETGIIVMGWLSIALVAVTGAPILLLLLAALLFALLALRARPEPWLLLFALSLLLFLLLPAAFILPSSRFGDEFGLWNLPGAAVGIYLALTTLIPLLLVARWFMYLRFRR